MQKQSFFGLWYNFNNIDAYTTGFYDTEIEAMEEINRHRSETTKSIIYVSNRKKHYICPTCNRFVNEGVYELGEPDNKEERGGNPYP